MPLRLTQTSPERKRAVVRVGLQWAALGVLLVLSVAFGRGGLAAQGAARDGPQKGATPKTYRYRPKHRIPTSLESVLKHLVPGRDAFPEEKEAEELAGRLSEMSARLRDHPNRAADAADWLLAPEFKGGRLIPASEVPTGNSPKLEIFRADTIPSDLLLDRAAFRTELSALLADFDSIQTAEFLITRIDVDGGNDPRVRTTVRFDLSGAAKAGWRAERLGHWQMRWQRALDGAWRVTEWTTLDHLRSRAPAPVFTEVTEAAFGGNA